MAGASESSLAETCDVSTTYVAVVVVIVIAIFVVVVVVDRAKLENLAPRCAAERIRFGGIRDAITRAKRTVGIQIARGLTRRLRRITL